MPEAAPLECARDVEKMICELPLLQVRTLTQPFHVLWLLWGPKLPNHEL